MSLKTKRQKILFSPPTWTVLKDQIDREKAREIERI